MATFSQGKIAPFLAKKGRFLHVLKYAQNLTIKSMFIRKILNFKKFGRDIFSRIHIYKV